MVTAIKSLPIFQARSTLFLPMYWPMKQLEVYMRPTGIMYVNRPIFLKMDCAAKSVSVSICASQVNTSKAHHPITLTRNEFHPTVIMSLKPFQESSCMIGIRHFYASLSFTTKVYIMINLKQKWIMLAIATPFILMSSYTAKQYANVQCIIDAPIVAYILYLGLPIAVATALQLELQKYTITPGAVNLMYRLASSAISFSCFITFVKNRDTNYIGIKKGTKMNVEVRTILLR